MKTLIAALIVVSAAAAACAFAGCYKSPDVPAPAPAGGANALPANLPPAEALAFIRDAKPVVIDIRTAEEHAAGYIEPTHLTLDFYAPDFKEQLAKLDRGASYLLYCRSGRRSGTALGLMKELGFSGARDLAGGIVAWSGAGYPVKK